MNYFTIHDSAKESTSELLAKCKAKFPVWSYWDDKELDHNFPKPEKPTTRYFQKTVEPDEKYRNMSADELEKGEFKGVTIRERIIMELQYFEETGEHLDIDGWTLCSGSRDAGVHVPRARWDGDGFWVYYASSSSRDPALGPREAISLNPSSSVPSIDEAVKFLEKNGYTVTRNKFILQHGAVKVTASINKAQGRITIEAKPGQTELKFKNRRIETIEGLAKCFEEAVMIARM